MTTQNPDGSLLDEAIRFAVTVHSGMTRKGTRSPYILHPLEAAAIVGGMTDDREVLAAAVLHDVVEDTPVTVDEIRARFGPRVAELVAAESEDKREDRPAAETWETRKQETLDALLWEEDPAVKMICLGDKLSNMRSLYRDSLVPGGRLWERFNQRDPARQARYYRGIADAVSELREFPAWQEYRSLTEQVFSGI